MKLSVTCKLSLFLAVVCLAISCKKNNAEPSFSATVNNQVYSFDSLFAWIDTSSASLNHYFLNIGAKDTKGNNVIYLAADSYGSKSFSGNYYFQSPLPYPLPNPYKWMNGGRAFLSTGQNGGSYNLGGSGVSILSIENATGSTLQGTFSILVNPTLANGATDLSQSLPMTGRFTTSYHYIP